jgi:energy-coupling factor transport system ATP-binding protein
VSAIELHGLSFAYPDGPRALGPVDLGVRGGEILLVVGTSGSGKSTLLRTINGLVPHATGGKLSGDVITFGRNVRAHKPRELADVVGFVHQDPEAQFVVDQVEADVAFVLENLAMTPEAMRRRVEEVLDALGIAHLRDRNPATLSGGERQRCAIAGALASAPSALVLDEPTSQLDPQGAEDVLAAVARLNADLGTTVVMSEHRLERAAPLADRAIEMSGGLVSEGPSSPGALLAEYPGAPSVTRLGRVLGWSPPPLTVREARRRAAETRMLDVLPDAGALASETRAAPGEPLLTGRGLAVRYGNTVALRDADVQIERGDVVALLGRNGSGKSTLLRVIARLLEPTRGTVAGRARAAYVPQDPNSLLFANTVREEIGKTLSLLGRRDPAAVATWIHRLHLEHVADRHPRSLSGGERQRVAIAAVAVGGADVLLLDEPTRGMDAASRHALEQAVADHARAGGAVVLATHDVELAARVATRAIVLGDGEIVASGNAREVLSGSLFAPQTLRVLPPYLTVEEVQQAMEHVG